MYKVITTVCNTKEKKIQRQMCISLKAGGDNFDLRKRVLVFYMNTFISTTKKLIDK